jgi:GGDEF domain-containing protein
MLRDISERKHTEKKIHTLAFYDSLTGLPNRSFFKKQFKTVLAGAKSHNDALAVFNIDLNRFKRINDTLGSSTGDAVLQKMAHDYRVTQTKRCVTGRPARQTRITVSHVSVAMNLLSCCQAYRNQRTSH